MKHRLVSLIWAALAASSPALAAPPAPFTAADLPEELRPWSKWVLSNYAANPCPFLYNSGTQRQCVWPSELQFNLGAQGADFTLRVSAYDETWIPLPGGAGRWPQQVRSGGQPLVVTLHDGIPQTHLPPGAYTITGRFDWPQLPESIMVPRGLGLMHIQVEGKSLTFPTIDENNLLWIKRQEAASTEAERADVKIFRRITDSIPARLTTHLTLSVSGKPREILLGRVLPEEFVPIDLQSAIPARIEPDGRLRLQVRPGTWDIDLSAHRSGTIAELAMPATGESDIPMPKEEIWVFEAMNHLRLVQPEGAPPVDPAQTELPPDWRGFPAFYMQPETHLKLTEKKRGNSDPAADELHLSRHWWLDFDGNGYTIRDTMHGTISQSWRLEVSPEMQLGRAAIEGHDQFITRLSESAPTGIEVRPGALNLEADSRIESARGSLAATGWTHDVRSLSGSLHLPPGWQLLHASGVDGISDSWVKRWTLLDIFLQLILIIVVHRLFGTLAAAITAPGFLLLHHALPPVTILSLVILACVALIRVLPQGKLLGWITLTRRVCIAVLIFNTLPFMVEHMRNAFFPQLNTPMGIPGREFSTSEHRGRAAMKAAPMPSAPAPAPMMDQDASGGGDSGVASEAYEGIVSSMNSEPLAAKEKAPMQQEIYQYDPGLQSNTGFGVASWEGNVIRLNWNGPVLSSQSLSLWLLSPTVNLALAALRVLLLAVIIAMLLGVPIPPRSKLKDIPAMAIKAFSILLALCMFLPAPARADDFPPPPLLEEMKQKLIGGMESPSRCLPDCVHIARASVTADRTEITIDMEIHSGDAIMIPLPGPISSWRPSRVSLVEGTAQPAVHSSADGFLYVQLPKGVYTVRMSGPLPTQQDTVGVTFPIPTGQLTATATGWEIQGIQPDGSHMNAIQLISTGEREKTAEATLEKNRFPALIEVERTINFGLSWQVQTVVRPLSPSESNLSVEIPLFPSETVTSAEVPVKQGKAYISMPPGVTERSWSSQLTPADSLTLSAPESKSWPDFVSGSEIWRLNISNLWHVSYEGIPPVKLPGSGASAVTNAGQQIEMPAFAPLPGESLKVAVTRPQGVPGQTLTVDRSQLSLSAGSRSLEASLNLELRASQGGQHTITLPEGAKLASANINGTALPVTLKDRQFTFPVSPGALQLSLMWNQPTEMPLRFEAPAVDIGIGSVNASTSMNLPRDRWVLFTFGPSMGPAVLFWGWIPVVVLAAIGLTFSRLTPLRFHQWLLLLLGLTQTSLTTNVIVAGWLLALGWRGKSSDDNGKPATFNARQVLLGFWTLISLSCLFGGIRHGLLGSPDMRIRGAGSSSYALQWFQDISTSLLPQPGVISLPVYCYRALMLAWALWLAFSLVRWLQWGWGCFTSGGYWKRIVITPWKRPDIIRKDHNDL